MKKRFLKYIFLFFTLLLVIFAFSGCSGSNTSTNIINNQENSTIAEQTSKYYKYDERINDFFSNYNNIISESPITAEMISKGNTYSKVTLTINNTYVVLLHNEHNQAMYFDIYSDDLNELKTITFNFIKVLDNNINSSDFDINWNNIISNATENLNNNITLTYSEPTQYYNKSQIKITYEYGD